MVLLHGEMSGRFAVRGDYQRPRRADPEHNWGVKSRFTAKRKPVALVWCEELLTREVARKRERRIKGSSREKKLELIERFERRGGEPLASLVRGSG